MIASYKYKPVIRIKDSVAMCHSVPAFTTFFEKSRMQRMGICFLTQHDRSRIFYHGLAVTVKEYNNICLKYGEGEILLPLRGFAPRKYSRLGRVRVALPILLICSLARLCFFRHRWRLPRSLSRALAFKSVLCKKQDHPHGMVLFFGGDGEI